MRSPADMQAQVSAHLRRHLFDVDDEAWPYRLSTQLPPKRALERDAAAVHRWNRAIRAWARDAGCDVSCERRVMGTPVELVSTVTVPSVACALGIVDDATADAYLRTRERFRRVRERFGVDAACAMGAVRVMADEPDLDFGLMLDAAAYFSTHEFDGLTARQIPLPGFSAKWLGTASSKRRRAICLLVGVDALALEERPGEVRWRRLDPRFADQPERITTRADQDDGCEAPRYALVVENKDTYLWMGAIEDAACVWGSGRAAARAAGLLPWLQGAQVVYWGDMDADGFEILSSLRAAGVSCESVFMDQAAFAAFEAYGTRLTPQGRPLLPREPKDGLSLTRDEYQLYAALCTGEGVSCLRIEQERIPLEAALDELRRRGWPVV